MKFTIVEELGIDFSDMMIDPFEFTKRVAAVAELLSAELDKSQTSTDLERKFEETACRNTDARERAKELLDKFLTEVLNESAEVCANVLDLLPDATRSIDSKVKSMGVRSISPNLSKRQLHAQYTALKKFYDTWVKFAIKLFDGTLMDAIMPDKVKIPILKAKPGNYSERFPEHGAKSYRFYFADSIDDDDYAIDPWFVANKLGITIKKWSDLSELIRKGEITGVRMVEY